MNRKRSQVNAFVGHCQTIAQDGDGGKSSWRGLEVLTEGSLPEVYRIDAGDAAKADPERRKQLRGLWHQLTQHLVDLGYVEQQAFRLYWKNHKSVLTEPVLLAPVISGVQTYLEEEQAPGIRQLISGLTVSDHVNQAWIEEHLGIVVEAIARYTSFDGTLPPPDDYQVGERSCYGRSLAFRIRVIYAMDDELAGAYVFDQRMLKYVLSLRNFLQFKREEVATTERKAATVSHQMWLNLNDIDRLFKAYLRALPEETRKQAYALVYNLQQTGGKAKVTGFQMVVSKKAKETAANNSRKWNAHRAKKATPVKSGMYAYVATRLLQIKLWQTSFYHGLIDGKWGPLAHAAAKAAYEQEVAYLKENKPKRTDNGRSYSLITAKRAMFWTEKKRKDKQVVAIDVEDLFAILQQYYTSSTKADRAGDDTVEVVDPAEQLLQQLKDKHQVTEEQIDRAVLSEKGVMQAYPDPKNAQHLDRRVAYPSQQNRSFFRGLFRGLRRIAQWVKRSLKIIFGPPFAFVKAFIDRIRKGVQLFAQGFRYVSRLLLGRPVVTAEVERATGKIERVYATRFRLDFDAVNFIPADHTTAGLNAHAEQLDAMNRSMFFFLDVVIAVVKGVAKLTSPGGWVWLGQLLFKLVFRQLKRIVGNVLAIA